MDTTLISRQKECAQIRRCMESDESEFIIICGRRRIGKTYLVERFFDKKYHFKYVGGHNLTTRIQLRDFAKALKKYSGKEQPQFKDWFDAFDALEEYLEGVEAKRKVVFIDEMPWMDSKRSDFVKALENFWNGWAAGEENIVLVATGSATSWMSDKLLKNRGGLHNRVTCRIYLEPFSLKETEAYLKKRRCPWSRYQILQLYMAMGGVPFYLRLLDVSESVAQNIDRLFFQKGAPMAQEFDELYPALFASSESYIKVVRSLASHRYGLTREEIKESVGFNGRNLTRILKNLEQCGFIAKQPHYGNKKRGTVYLLVDFFTLFYFQFLDNGENPTSGWWAQNFKSQAVVNWEGLTFEIVCMLHPQQIKNALGIGNVATTVSSWRYVPTKLDDRKGVQIDMVMRRADDFIHLFEAKFHNGPIPYSSAYEEHLREREETFRQLTDTQCSVVTTLISTFGLKNPHSWSALHSSLTMQDLFKS
ncbi:MAG: ATP-binding protein [Bacteroidales bacterium]|nr:ATP-binding protein [Bacteroidales bacterium]